MAINSNLNRLNGLNPLSYMGVDPYTPPDLVIYQRDPNQNDNANVNIGTIWLNTGTDKVWMLINLDAGYATWVPLYPQGGGGGAENFVTDAGTAVSNAGTINVVGGKNINTAGATDVVTVNLDDNVHLLGNLEVDGSTVLNGVVELTSVGKGVLQTNVLGGVSGSVGTNGQLLIGRNGGLNPVWNNITSTDMSITVSDGSGTIDLSANFAAGTILITPFTAGTSTWTKNANSKLVEVYGWNGGNGGGSGRQGAGGNPGTAGGGAGGAGNGGFYIGPVLATFFPTTATVTVGAGGAGGVSQVTANTDGNTGGIGAASAFGNFAPLPVFIGAAGGTTGTTVSLAVGLSPVLSPLTVAGSAAATPPSQQAGAAGQGTVNNANFPSPLNIQLTTTTGGAGGGGAGAKIGGIGSYDGTAGQGWQSSFTSAILLAGGVAGGEDLASINGGNGNPYTNTSGWVTGGSGGGGGGGQFTNLVGGGNGGNGGFPGGSGGGGGASLNGFPSGSGGNGADGLVLVVEYL